MVGLKSLQQGARRRLAQGRNDELLDALAVSGPGRALNPLAKLLHRNASLSLNYEIARGLALAFAYANAEQIEGDYAEFAVWKGRTFLEALRVGGAAEGTERRFFAFDTFEGLPPIEGPDLAGRFAAGEFRYSREAFEGRLRRASAPRDRVHIVEGPFTAARAHPERIPLERVAIAYVDSPIYTLTEPILDYLTPRLVDGAIVMFDAWLCFKGAPNLGQKGAGAAWLERNPDITLIPTWQYNWAGQAFIVRRRSAGDADRQAL